MRPYTKHKTYVFKIGGDHVRLDIKTVREGRSLKDFAINVALIRKNRLTDVFRVDTAHGYLHKQEFWATDKPIKLQEKRKKDYKGDYGYWKDEVSRKLEHYLSLFKSKK